MEQESVCDIMLRVLSIKLDLFLPFIMFSQQNKTLLFKVGYYKKLKVFGYLDRFVIETRQLCDNRQTVKFCSVGFAKKWMGHY